MQIINATSYMCISSHFSNISSVIFCFVFLVDIRVLHYWCIFIFQLNILDRNLNCQWYLFQCLNARNTCMSY